MGKRKVAIGVLLAVITAVGLYLVNTAGQTVPTIDGLGGFVDPKPAGSGFMVKGLSIEPKEVQVGETVNITVSVANKFNTSGVYSLVLDINGAKEAEKQASLGAGSSQNVTFSVIRQSTGKYAVFVNGLSGTFTVVPAR